MQSTVEMDSDATEAIIGRLARMIDITIIGLVVMPAILVIWGVFDSLPRATKELLALGFNLGNVRINLALVLVSMSILYGSFLVSWVAQKLLVDGKRFKIRTEKGVRLSMARLAHYGIVTVGFLIAISTLGLEISKITIMLSALGVGIGFGLQGVANNFVSGLILLFERPVRVGDIIQLTDDWAEITHIGIRATTVRTFDCADKIIPNGSLISSEVTNWTLTNRRARIIIPVGVAYGSDATLVTETLLACARDNPKVSPHPQSQVIFMGFGESSLNFELRAFVSDFNQRVEVKSTLHYQIEKSFRDAKIEIAFPQCDLHLRSLDPAALAQPIYSAG
jgi:small-conductance mechanosensitive channel